MDSKSTGGGTGKGLELMAAVKRSVCDTGKIKGVLHKYFPCELQSHLGRGKVWAIGDSWQIRWPGWVKGPFEVDNLRLTEIHT